jgi:hypothetical protein
MQAQACSSLKAACHVNLALIAQKEADYTEAFKWCDKALRYAFQLSLFTRILFLPIFSLMHVFMRERAC